MKKLEINKLRKNPPKENKIKKISWFCVDNESRNTDF